MVSSKWHTHSAGLTLTILLDNDLAGLLQKLDNLDASGNSSAITRIGVEVPHLFPVNPVGMADGMFLPIATPPSPPITPIFTFHAHAM